MLIDSTRAESNVITSAGTGKILPGVEHWTLPLLNLLTPWMIPTKCNY